MERLGRNFWKETIEFLENKGKIFDDVIAIYGEDFSITKENFEKVAKRTNYDSEYGGPYIAEDLIILGKDFIIKRFEYDGLEDWEYISLVIPKEVEEIKVLSGATYALTHYTVKELNYDEYEYDDEEE